MSDKKSGKFSFLEFKKIKLATFLTLFLFSLAIFFQNCADSGFKVKQMSLPSQSLSTPQCIETQSCQCRFNEQIINSNESVTAYFRLSVGPGETCQREQRTCNNGQLSGSFTFSSCTPDTQQVGTVRLVSGVAVANNSHLIRIEGQGLTPQTRVFVRDSNWNQLKIYSASNLNLELQLNPQRVSLSLSTELERRSLFQGLIVTVENGLGTWDSISIASPTIKLFLVMGQSNAVGFRGDSALLPSSNVDSQIPFLYINGNRGSNNCTLGSNGFVPLGVQNAPSPCLNAEGTIDYLFAYNPGFGPEIGIARKIASSIGTEFAMFKFAWNSSSLFLDWDPESISASRLYPRFTETLQTAIAQLNNQGFHVKVSALFWMQGESDSISIEAANSYQERLVRFIGRVRTEVQNPQLPFISGLIAPLRVGNSWTYAETVREAQRTVSTKWVETADLSTDIQRSGDGVHYNSQGLLTLGERLANAYLQIP